MILHNQNYFDLKKITDSNHLLILPKRILFIPN